MEDGNRRLMWHGLFLFLLGLLTGFAEQHFANVRMGLAAHLEGVMNGIFLMALGAIWNEVRLPSSTKMIAYWTALYGSYVNWLSHHSGGRFWYRGAVPYFLGRPYRAALAGGRYHGGLLERWCRYSRLGGSWSSGDCGPERRRKDASSKTTLREKPSGASLPCTSPSPVWSIMRFVLVGNL